MNCIRQILKTSLLPSSVAESTLVPNAGLSLDTGRASGANVMETGFYGALPGVTMIPPVGRDLDKVHQSYVSMAAAGFVTDAQRSVFHSVSRTLLTDQGVQAIMLAGTDLALVFNENTAEFPLIDCAAIHVDAIAKLALA